MPLTAWLSILRLPDLGAQLGIARDAAALVRLHFLYAASTSGLLKTLRTGASGEEVAQRLGASRTDLLDALLELGVALGELACDDGRYRIRGKRSAALADDRGDALVAIVEEAVTYHGAVYRDLPARLHDGSSGDYLAGNGPLIARSSRVLEPFMLDFVRQVVASSGPLRLLEIGCGSGIYLRHAATVNPQAGGIGIDLQDDVVRQTSSRLGDWGLADRFRVLHADIRTPPPELAGPFDLITLYNNIYYFPPADRVALLRSLRDRLTDGGRLALISMFQARSVGAANFDLVLRSTLGCAPLGTVDDLVAQLHDSGFTSVTTTRLIPLQPFYGVTARR